jgi:hypothetical protein
MADVQRFRIAPVTATSVARSFRAFPIQWIVVSVPFFMLALGGCGLLIPSMRMPWGVAALVIAGGLLVPALLAFAVFCSRRGTIEIDGFRLDIRGVPLGLSANLLSLRPAEARWVNLVDDRSHRPTSGGGLNLPSYLAGWGSFGHGERVAWLLTDLGRVVYLPAREGPSLLISAESPEALIEALRSLP